MPVKVSNNLVDSFHSFEFVGLGKGIFSDPLPTYQNFFSQSVPVELFHDFKENVMEQVFKELDFISSEVYSNFSLRSRIKQEPHGAISYVRNASIFIPYKNKRILLNNVQFIKLMTRNSSTLGFYEFRVDFNQSTVVSYIPEFKELVEFLKQSDLVYRGFFVTGKNEVSVLAHQSSNTITVNKFFFAFLDKAKEPGSHRYNEAFLLMNNRWPMMQLAVANSKGDVLNGYEPRN